MWSLVAGPFTDYANQLSGRTKMPKLNRKQLEAYELSYPDKKQQKKVIVSKLNSLRKAALKLGAIQEAAQRELYALLPAILDRAFKGEL